MKNTKNNKKNKNNGNTNKNKNKNTKKLKYILKGGDKGEDICNKIGPKTCFRQSSCDYKAEKEKCDKTDDYSNCIKPHAQAKCKADAACNEDKQKKQCGGNEDCEKQMEIRWKVEPKKWNWSSGCNCDPYLAPILPLIYYIPRTLGYYLIHKPWHYFTSGTWTIFGKINDMITKTYTDLTTKIKAAQASTIASIKSSVPSIKGMGSSKSRIGSGRKDDFAQNKDDMFNIGTRGATALATGSDPFRASSTLNKANAQFTGQMANANAIGSLFGGRKTKQIKTTYII